MPEIAIIGGGIGGLSTAIGLRDVGYEPVVYEAAPEFRPVGAGILIPPNGLDALARLDVDAAVREVGTTMTEAVIRSMHGETLLRVDFDAYDTRTLPEAVGVAVHRATLHRNLRGYVPEDAIELGARCVAVDHQTGTVSFEDGREVTADRIIGADGIGSAVRQSVFPDVTPTYADEIAYRGVAEDVSVAYPGTGVELWGEGERFGWAQIDEGRLYWFATIPAPQPADVPEYAPSELAAQFAYFGDAVASYIDASDRLIRTPLADLRGLETWSRGRVTLLGDAAHAMTPNLGQGGAQAMQDAACLVKVIDTYGCTPQAVDRYEATRKPPAERTVRASRLQGRIGRISHPVGRRVRNTVMKLTPEALVHRQLARQTRG